MRVLHVLDVIDLPKICECGCGVGVVDGNGEGRYWLLCLDSNHRGCVNTQELQEDVKIEE